MADKSRDIVYNLSVKSDGKDLDKLNKQTKKTGKNLGDIKTKGKGAEGGLKNVGGMAGKTGGMMGKLGGVLGNLPKIFTTVATGAKALFAVLTANPIGLILTIIGALIGVIIAVVSKFQPLLDWISDKIAYVTGMVDAFVESMSSIGDILAAVFSGDFAKAGEMMTDMGDRMLATAEAAETLNKVLREYEVQQKLNDATSAEVAAKMKQLEGVYKDQGKSIEERNKAFEQYYEMRKVQAQDDLDAQTKVTAAEIALFNAKYRVQVKNATEINAYIKENANAREDGLALQDTIIKQTTLEGKVAEEGSKKAQEGNRLRTQGLTEQLKLLKARTKYYEATHQSILEGEKTFSAEMLAGEEERLTNIQTKRITQARKEYALVQLNYADNANKLKEAELKYATEVINIKKATNKTIEKNQETFNTQQLTTLKEAFNLLNQENIVAIKDTTIATKKELNERLGVHKVISNEQIKIIEATAKAEGWSNDKLKTELLKIEQGYTATVLKLNKSLADNLAKGEAQRVKDKKDATKLLEDIEKGYLDSRQLSINEAYAEESAANKTMLDQKNADLKLAYDNNLISDEKYTTAKKEADATYVAEQAETDAVYAEEKMNALSENIAVAQALSQAFQDFNNAQRDLELAKIKEKYDAEDKLANDKYGKEANKFKKQLTDGLITQKKYDKEMGELKNTFDAEQKTREDARVAAENKAKKEAFDKNKKFQIASTIMAGAQAIIGTWSGYATMGLPGTILAAVQTALIAGTTAMQVATINQQQFSAAGGGILQGSLHAAGGINMGDVEGEGGEFIINRASTKKYTPLLNSINQAGNTNGDTNNVDKLIDYEKLAGAMQSKKTYVTSKDITDVQAEDTKVKDRTEF